MKNLGLALFIIFSNFCCLQILAQTQAPTGKALLDKLLSEEKIEEATKVVQLQIQNFKKNGQYDSLSNYPYYIGKISSKKNSTEQAIRDAERFVDNLILETPNRRIHITALMDLADLYDEFGKNQKSLDITQRALTTVLKLSDAKPEEIGKVRYNLGACNLSLSHLEEAARLFKAALKDYESSKTTPKKLLSDGYNAAGAVMWMSTKLDSAQFFYEKAISTIQEDEGDPIEKLYFATVIKSNISLLQYSEGNMTKALITQEAVINGYEKVIKEIGDEFIKSKSQRYQARAIANLSTFYNEIGNLSKSHELIKYSYEKKLLFLDPNDKELATTLINIGQSHLSLQEFDLAIENLNEGLTRLEKSDGNYSYWKAAALYAKAISYTSKGDLEKAKQLYDESEKLFDESQGDNYDAEYLGFLRNKALFLSENDQPELAVKTALKAHSYLQEHNKESDFPILNHKLNVAQVYYNQKAFDKAREWCDNANNYLSEQIKKSSSSLDSILIEFKRPSLILLKSKSEYQLATSRDEAFLQHQLSKLEDAFDILERRKTIAISKEDIDLIYSEYKSLYDYTKKLNFELYQLSGKNIYLNKTMELHESGIYQRIRAKLNIGTAVAFANVPEKVIDREKELKNNLHSILDKTKADVNGMNDFFSGTKEWELFLDSLKQTHPKYYKMRYATIKEPLDGIQHKMGDNTTVVRYLFIDNDLYAYVINSTEQNIFQLESQNLNDHLALLNSDQFKVDKIAPTLKKLYGMLWQPIESKVTTKNVMIIPDRELFNLSFEMLTPQEITSFKELTSKSLLAKHCISYNFSLLLLNSKKSDTYFDEDFIAFAPEFTTEMKDDYKIAITDSISLDKTYLTLLPQPFSADLVKRFSKQFKGESFTNKSASKQIFSSSAGEHKIIHIGTHAESNNLSPELSRLIFAKNAADGSTINDNSLYTYEIYNCNLSSSLAILTACETGKPSYQPGEGMISLAHAFNYAGSESMLTSLWKIDEKSSSEIIESFYENLSDGLPKNEALQKAKLSYLARAEGRTLAPQYWAGMILIGDTSPIELSSGWHWGYLLLFGLAVMLLILYLKKRA